MAVEAETRQQWLDDVVNTVGNTFLGLEMSCFKCHDHKFDPLPTRDYYSMQAVFATTQPADVGVALRETSTGNDYERKSVAAKALVDRLSAEDSKAKIGGFGRSVTLNRLQRWNKQFQPLAMSIYKGPTRTFNSNSLSNLPPSIDKRSGDLMILNILAGGSLAAPIEPVELAALSAVESLNEWQPSPFPETVENRRRALADWIVDESNPLPARVIVNRVWGWHFGGQSLVATPNNFGVKGSKPSHPELLDWLARWFVDHGYSFKKLHRLIMTSNAYQRSIMTPDKIDSAQANKILASFPVRHVSAEEMRDIMLQCSGELARNLGGIPSRPQMNWDAAMTAVNVQGGIDIPYRPDLTPSERNRRSIYTYRMRSRRDPLFEVFNQPSSERSCGIRDESIVVPQAFTLMNGDFIADRSLALADQLLKRLTTMPQCVDAAYSTIFGREPTIAEKTKCLDFVAAQFVHHKQYPTPRFDVAKKIAGLTPYDPEYAKRYVADLQSADVPPRTRALADLCLTLFNTSELLYIP